MPSKSIRYLNEAALEGLGLGMGEIVDILEDLFREKAKGELLMPPKIENKVLFTTVRIKPQVMQKITRIIGFSPGHSNKPNWNDLISIAIWDINRDRDSLKGRKRLHD